MRWAEFKINYTTIEKHVSEQIYFDVVTKKVTHDNITSLYTYYTRIYYCKREIIKKKLAITRQVLYNFCNVY